MKSRRRFLSTTVGLMTGIGLSLSPAIRMLKSAYGVVKKRILPREIKMRALIRRNPSTLDTRNLMQTPLQEFRTMGETKHKTDQRSWRLEVTGKVTTELSFSYLEMLDLPSIERKVLLICPGFFAQHGSWKGIDMQKLLTNAGVTGGKLKVTFSGVTGSRKNTNSFSIGLVLSNQVFLAYQVNGKTLPEKHGFPLRVVAEEAYGSNWVKYVNSIRIEKS